jgi:hypothetical protein
VRDLFADARRRARDRSTRSTPSAIAMADSTSPTRSGTGTPNLVLVEMDGFKPPPRLDFSAALTEFCRAAAIARAALPPALMGAGATVPTAPSTNEVETVELPGFLVFSYPAVIVAITAE